MARFQKAPGIDVTANKISIDLATNPGLDFDAGGDSGKLRVDLDTNSGLALGAGGISINLNTLATQGDAIDATNDLLAVYDASSGTTESISVQGLLQGSGVTPTFPTVKIEDTDQSNTVELKWNEDDTSDRVLNFEINAADRTIDLTGNLTIGGDLTTDGALDIVTSGQAAGSILIYDCYCFSIRSGKYHWR